MHITNKKSLGAGVSVNKTNTSVSSGGAA